MSASTPAPAVILVRPQLGENIGACARAMLNFGLTDMRLVAPRDGWPNPEAWPRASGADRVLDDARVYPTLAEAIADLMADGLTPTDGQKKGRPPQKADGPVRHRRDGRCGHRCHQAARRG